MGNPPIDFFHFPIKDGRLILSESYALPIRTTASGTVLTGIRPEAWEPGSGIRVTIETLEQRGRDVLAGFTLTGAKGKAVSYTHLDVYKRQLLSSLCPWICLREL